ncbi:MAG: hypothetical protein AAFZ58_01985 [Pseudomonadota bacterium]
MLARSTVSRLLTIAFAWLALASPPALAQNTAGVFGPVVNEGHRSAQYRIAFEADTDAFAHRLHYQESVGDDLMWRIVGQARKTEDSDNDFDFIQGELFWQLNTGRSGWDSGFRFDALVRHEGRPGLAGVHWMNDFHPAERWRLRAVAMTGVQIGDGAADGVFLQFRSQINYRTTQGYSVGLETYSGFGSTDDLAGIKDQSHEVGPYLEAAFAERWTVFASALAGLTDGSQDLNLKLWITRGF